MINRVERLSARTKTMTFGLALTLAALALTLHSALLAHHHNVTQSDLILIVAMAVTFFLTEQFTVNIEFWREYLSLTLAGIPLCVGIVLLPAHELVIARLVGSLAALLLQRISADKVIYNMGAYAFEAALGGTVVRLWLPLGAQLNAADLLGLLICIATVDQVMSALALSMVKIRGDSLTKHDVADVLVPSLTLSLVATVFACALQVLMNTGLAGGLLDIALIAVAVAIIRTHAATARRHQSLEMVHDFVAANVRSTTLEALAHHSLSRIRQLMRAAGVELYLHSNSTERSGNDEATDASSHQGLRFCLSENDEMTITQLKLDPVDWVESKAVTNGEATIATRHNADPATLRWLNARGLREAMVVPLREASQVLGVVTVADRLGHTTTFTAHDLSLLQILTSHLAVAIRNTRLVETLSHDATHDALTGLANRACLSTRIADAVGVAAEGEGVAVLLLDVDRFKEVNDVLGHEVGDRLLVVIARRLTACLPDSATVARIGGDEFAVLLPVPAERAAEVATEFARLAVADILRPVWFDEAVLTPEVSVGIAITPCVTATDLLRRADTAMYAAKTADDAIAHYHPDMDSGRAERLALVVDLRIAVDDHPEQFTVCYQPKTDLATGNVVSAEALVRWHHPLLGVLAPDRFIPLAESTGLIDRLTEHVLAAALAECARWNERGHRVSVAVNLSPRNVADATLPSRIERALERAGVAPRSLILEITESGVMHDPDRAVHILNDLVRLGISLSLDDFGTGYSSLSYLQRLPVAELKIDRSFVAGLASDNPANARALIRSITALAANLNLNVVAEGIEDRSQLDEVRRLGCHIGQGYFISRPIAAADFHTWLDCKRPDSTTELQLVPTSA